MKHAGELALQEQHVRRRRARKALAQELRAALAKLRLKRSEAPKS
jgi:hypothetical protein